MNKRSDLICDRDDEISPRGVGICFLAHSSVHPSARAKASLLQWIRYRFMLHADPVRRSEFFDRPLAVVAPETAVLLSAKRAIRQIIDRRIIDVSHARVEASREAGAALEIARHHCGR